MIGDFNPQIVLLSFAISFLGAYVAIGSCEQLRGIYLKYGRPNLADSWHWLSLIGLSIGGVAIWSMHFLGMSAMTLTDSSGNDVRIDFNVGVSIFSVFAAVLSVIGGVVVASRDVMFAKSKAEILEFFVESISLEEMINYTEFDILILLATRRLTNLILGGCIAGSGVVIMHYIGMAAMEFPGQVHWNYGIIVASIVIAVVAGTAAFWIFFRLLSIYPDSELLRLASALVMGIAVCGMHYIGMLAADFRIDYTKTTELSWKAGTMDHADALYPVLLAAMILLWVFTMVVQADLRSKISKYRVHLQKLSPNEKLSLVLLTAENSGDEGDHNHGSRTNKVAVAPLPFDDNESPI
mmetsp:Transcript_4077/g.4481  ORF Transcript_4077/g.4481 Transcript_4077/m.4481 type:complete len:352 (+) Transcript_4077:30-1085(+)